MVNSIRIHQNGGPDVLHYEHVETPVPGPGEVRVRHEAVGVNFIDIYFRTGLYKAPQLPFTPGQEGAGIVVAIGPDVTNVKLGDRVAYVATLGSYADERLVPAERLVIVPPEIDLKLAASMMLKGMTAYYLLHKTYKVQRGDTILFHAAAGGVGQIAGQWARHLGATVIGTAGTPEKVELARSLGYHHVINYREENFVERVKEITSGQGVPVVYDSVGRDTFPASLDVLSARGMFVSFGQSSGALPAFDLSVLSQRGSLYATRPTLFNYISSTEELQQAAKALFDIVASGVVRVSVNQVYNLCDAADAHRDLETRRTTGSTILIP